LAVMSATLDAEPIAEYLSANCGVRPPSSDSGAARKAEHEESAVCPVLISEGQSFPVEVRYSSHHDERPITDQAADAVEAIISSGEPGDILVFMPGMGEINSTIGAIHAIRASERLALIPLHGDLPA